MTDSMAYAPYLLVRGSDRPLAERREAFSTWLRGVEAEKARIPPALYEFMTAPWHHDHRDRRALHDMRLRSLTVSERASDGHEAAIAIDLVLLGAYFDRELRLSYGNVSRYATGIPEPRRPPRGSHGDVLGDEIAVLPTGEIVHAIEFSCGSLFEIAFRGSFNWSFAELPG